MSVRKSKSYDFEFQQGRCTLDLSFYTVPKVRGNPTRWFELEFKVARRRTKPGVSWAAVLRRSRGSLADPAMFDKLYDNCHRKSLDLESFVSDVASNVRGMLRGAVGSLNNPPLAAEAARMAGCIAAFAQEAAGLGHDEAVVYVKMTFWYQRHPDDREQGFDLNVSLE